MAIYLDTSALAKFYHQETGSGLVEEMLSNSQAVFVSRLGLLEMHSVLAGKVRTKMLTPAGAELTRRRFRSDVRKRFFRVIALRVRHYELAETLVDNCGASLGFENIGLASAGDCAGPTAERVGGFPDHGR